MLRFRPQARRVSPQRVHGPTGVGIGIDFAQSAFFRTPDPDPEGRPGHEVNHWMLANHGKYGRAVFFLVDFRGEIMFVARPVVDCTARRYGAGSRDSRCGPNSTYSVTPKRW